MFGSLFVCPFIAVSLSDSVTRKALSFPNPMSGWDRETGDDLMNCSPTRDLALISFLQNIKHAGGACLSPGSRSQETKSTELISWVDHGGHLVLMVTVYWIIGRRGILRGNDLSPQFCTVNSYTETRICLLTSKDNYNWPEEAAKFTRHKQRKIAQSAQGRKLI